ncbi:hypothetical protein QWY93_03115 [Echinicola jeungdonensis]|uniref:Beta-lactamase-inhibitor-like PepSY-like domain-containing protein n=1 Tax=Echinicola jeungdonensis TaxID=709343 RepID=A0ABV5J0X7_9BACT|nr:hypothetical protein [Echinicola jeungdonensis]MDN3668318.1 hypothetical protein [Echinicola jeungdonensis]
MKKLLYLMSIPAFVLVSCGGQNENKDSHEEHQDSLSHKMEEPNQEMTEVSQMEPVMEGEKTEVKVEMLPEMVTKKVEKDTLLSSLVLEKAYLVEAGEEEKLYDLTFKTQEGEVLKVSFDEKGNLIEL